VNKARGEWLKDTQTMKFMYLIQMKRRTLKNFHNG
jgi:hypothetical protein